MEITIHVGINDTNRNSIPKGIIPNEFIPRIGDTLILENLYWDVKSVVIDYDTKEIRVWVKDSEHFK